MALNKQKGNMYKFVNFTWNPIRGECPHDCNYCYMKRHPQKPLTFDMTAAEKDKLGAGNTIFVGSSTDMWASDVPDTWISEVLRTCRLNPSNTYLFQSKNPIRFINFINMLPPKVILGTTIETNRDTSKYSKALPPVERYGVMKHITRRKMVSIEPIMDFDLITLINWIAEIKPEFVSIGADSGNNHLPEPDKEKLKMFIEDLKQITEVKVKNLSRLL